MNGITPALALTDYIPVCLFGIGAFYFLRIGYGRLSMGRYTAMSGGAVLCFLGGFFKATSKLLEAFTGQLIPAMQESQFIMLAPGFLLLFIAAMGLLCEETVKRKGVAPLAIVPWKIPFIAIMTLANIGFLVVMAQFSLKNKWKTPAVCYVLSILVLLIMPYLSSKTMTADIQWISQGINSIIQLLAMIGHIALYKGLRPKVHQHQASV